MSSLNFPNISIKPFVIQLFSRFNNLLKTGLCWIRTSVKLPTKKFYTKSLVVASKRRPRRDFVKTIAGLPFLAIFTNGISKNIIVKEPDPNSETAVKFDYDKIDNKTDEPEIKIPTGKLCGYEISRLIMGCNPISGFAHARDLKYANQLFKAYHTDEKIIETFHLAESKGINTTFMVNRNYPYFKEYLNKFGGKMHTIYQIYLKEDNFLGDIDLAISNGANLLYIQGGESDRYVREGKIDLLGKAILYIKQQGYPAGIGAHSIEVIKSCEREEIPADFYVKTFHHDKYWSAHPVENRIEFSVDTQKNSDHNMIHDNMFDLFPEKTAEFMKNVTKPWIAFKVLAAGAIMPKDGFRYAFENGADFICAGMFDFQIEEDVNVICEILGTLKNRKRNWYS